MDTNKVLMIIFSSVFITFAAVTIIGRATEGMFYEDGARPWDLFVTISVAVLVVLSVVMMLVWRQAS